MFNIQSNNNIALISPTETLTYRELLHFSDEVASSIPERSLVFLVASNTVAAITGYLGILNRRAVVQMVKNEVQRDEFAVLLESYRPQFIWLPLDRAAALLEDYSDYRVVSAFGNYLLYATGNTRFAIHPDTALLLSTSGSTGSPKHVRITYANLEDNAASIAQYQSINNKDRAITTLPFSYSYGISIINSHLISGASIAITECGVLSRQFWDFLREVKATNFGGVPYTYQMLDKLGLERISLQSIRFLSQAGGRLGESLQKKVGSICAEKGIQFYVMYGQTEATARMSWLPPELCLSKLGSIGIPIPGGEFELLDSSGERIFEPNTAGELVYKGKNVSQGYATNAQDLSAEDAFCGVLYTGDVARRDEDGFYYIVGRMKRFLKLYGNRVNLDEVERILLHRGIEVVCVGTDDHMVVFTTREDIDVVRQEVCSSILVNSHCIEVRNIEGIPHTGNGKVDYQELERQC